MRRINPNKKGIWITLIAIILLFSFILARQRAFSPRLPAESYEKPVVAACPTFYYLLEKLEENGFSVLRTKSTAESFYLLEKEEVDAAISGRATSPGEPDFSFNVIGPGYSFLSSKEKVIMENEMGFVDFFTDMEKEIILNDFPFISENNLRQINDVYDYLEEGVIITSVLNTDYSRGRVVHVFRENGERVRLSRTPVFYYQEKEKERLRPALSIIEE